MVNTSLVCAQVDAYTAQRGAASPAYRGISLVLFIGPVVLWIIGIILLCLYQNHRRLRTVRPVLLNFVLAVGQVLWSMQCLNLVIDDLPCVFMPLSILMGMTVTSINFYVRLVVFTIESQFAKNAHLFKTNRDTDTRSDDSLLAVAPYFRSMASLMRLTFGLTSLDRLDIAEIVKAKHSYASITMASMLPGLIVLISVIAADGDVYFNCKGCSMPNAALFGFLAMGSTYAMISGRITYVLIKAKFADEHGVLNEFKWVWAFCITLLPVCVFWLVDINDVERVRGFAYEWLFQLPMITYWWFAVGYQIHLVRKDSAQVARRKLSVAAHTPILFTEEDSHNAGFEAYMVRQLAIENLYFLQDIYSYKRYYLEKNESWRRQKSQFIYETYIRSGGAMELNISDSMRRRVTRDVMGGGDDHGLEFAFDVVVNDVRTSIVLPLWASYELNDKKARKIGGGAQTKSTALVSDVSFRPSTGASA